MQVDLRRTENPVTQLPVSAVVITRDEADRIGRCLASLVTLCDEVLVMDSGSTDDTVAIARAAGATVIEQKWLGFAEQKNAVVAQASNKWVLLLDADEWLGNGAAEAITELHVSGRIEECDVWRLQRRTHFLGKALRFGGWGRESVERLFRKRMRYQPALVHERLQLGGVRCGRLQARIEHDTARDEAEYRRKLDAYSSLFARQRHREGRRASLLDAPLHAFFYAFKNGLVRGGFLDGPHGWRFHLAHARYVWDKYRRLWQLGLRRDSFRR